MGRDRFVRAHPQATLFHLTGWRRSVERVFGHQGRDIVALRGGEIVGVLPLMLCKTPFFGAHLVSMPYGVYGGPLGTDRGVTDALVGAACDLARAEGVGRLELRCLHDVAPELVRSELYATFLHPLPSKVEDVMTNMPKRARAEVRKASEKHGLALVEGPEHLGALVELFGASKQALGSPGLPRAWFEALISEFGADAVLHAARREGATVAATLSFTFQGTFLFYYIGTSQQANREWNATNFLCTRLQEWSVARGLSQFDLGRSRVDSGPYHFKLHQGFEARPLSYRYLLVKSKELPNFNPSNPRTQKLRDAWAKLPPALARALAGRMMRYLP